MHAPPPQTALGPTEAEGHMPPERSVAHADLDRHSRRLDGTLRRPGREGRL